MEGVKEVSFCQYGKALALSLSLSLSPQIPILLSRAQIPSARWAAVPVEWERLNTSPCAGGMVCPENQ